MPAVSFTATLKLARRTATGFVVPPELVEQLGGGKRPLVVVRLGDDHQYRSAVGSMNGVAMVPVSAEQRAASGVAAGDEIAVTLALDTAPRTVELPDDLAAALAAEPAAQKFFATLSPSLRRFHVTNVESARRADTRARRVEKAVALLKEGRAR